MEDSKILDLFFARDETAIIETKGSYGRQLRRLALRLLENSEDAEESESDTYLTAWNHIPPTRPQYFYGYLAKICRYLAFGKLDWHNAQKRKAQVVALSEELASCIPVACDDFSIEGEALGRLLDIFLGDLPLESRLIFMGRYWFADSIKDIAAQHHIGESKVKTTLHRTRNKLKVYLAREGITV